MQNGSRTVLTAELVRSVCGQLSDEKVRDILTTGAGLGELEEAMAWAAGDDEHTPLRHLPPEGAAAKAYDVLVAGEQDEEC
ncbi:hypothetical protein [Roseibium sp.]|uniref:hypothetical protein n=1 Tax=Roseibium sp. TaxID=1936156 RepID=UPI003A98341D